MPELIQFMLPGLAHASSSSVLRGVMSESNIAGLITECFLLKSASIFIVKLMDSACNEVCKFVGDYQGVLARKSALVLILARESAVIVILARARA